MRASTTRKDQFDDLDATTGTSQAGSRAISRILQEIVNHVTEIIRSEVQLARTEVRQDVTQVANASAFLAIGAAFGLFALGFILFLAWSMHWEALCRRGYPPSLSVRAQES